MLASERARREQEDPLMRDTTHFYIDGEWVPPATGETLEVIDPADETPFASISLGSPEDVDRAVAAAARAFDGWKESALPERIALLRRLEEIYEKRSDEMAKTISREMGAPIRFATDLQASSGLEHIRAFIRDLEEFRFEHPLRPDEPDQHLLYEPIGVCGLITPWNWPMNQVTLKVVPALAVGCTVLLKPSEIAPLSALLFAEMIDEAGFPKGVFNLVNGEGPTVGEAMSRHPGIDMMSLTGSIRAGTAVTKAAAETVKRVTLELGGKSANLVFADAGLPDAVRRGAASCFENTGQSCDAPTRMLVERSIYEEAVELAIEAANATRVGDPSEDGDHIGPLVSRAQFEKVQGLIQEGIDEGARLVAGGPGRPEGLDRGYYARPTVFADVTDRMTIAQREIFGPVLAMSPFDGEEEAIRVANGTTYGLAAYVQSADPERLRRVARGLRAGVVQLGGTFPSAGMPFGGYKQSGNGREGGRWGLAEYLEVKAVSGWVP
jgi:aldehyde dehydrogenase (NAD+)